MNIVVIGVGYVGLVTGLGLAKLNHNIQFLDIDKKPILIVSTDLSRLLLPQADKSNIGLPKWAFLIMVKFLK